MDQKPIKTTTIRNPDRRPDGNYSGGILGPDKKLSAEIKSAANKDLQSVRNDSRLNPAGKARFKQDAKSTTSWGGWGSDRITTVNTTYGSDARHAARLRGRAWDARAKASAASPAKK